MTGRKAGWMERLLAKGINTLTEATEGYSVSFTEELVKHHGIKGFFKFAQVSNEGWTALCLQFGERHAHLLAAFGSFWNGCNYCTYGHLLAHNLIFFRDEGYLFPLDEVEMAELGRQRDSQIHARIQELLGAPAFARSLALISRQLELKQGASALTDEDQLLLRANALYEWVNECSIVSEPPSPPMGKVARDLALRRRYEQARARARGTPSPRNGVS